MRRDFPLTVHSDILINVCVEVARALNYALVPAEFNRIRLRKVASMWNCINPIVHHIWGAAHKDDVLVYVEEACEYKTLVAEGALSETFRQSLDVRLAMIMQEFRISTNSNNDLMDLQLEYDYKSFKREAKALYYFSQQLSRLDWQKRIHIWRDSDPADCMNSLREIVVDSLSDALGPAEKSLFNMWDLAGISVETFVFSKIAEDLWLKYRNLHGEDDEQYRRMRDNCPVQTHDDIRELFGVEGDAVYRQSASLLFDLERQWSNNVIVSRTESLEKLHRVRIALKVEALESEQNLDSMDDLCPAFCMVVFLSKLRHPIALQHLVRDLLWSPEERTSSDGMVTSLLETAVVIVCSELRKLTASEQSESAFNAII